MTRDYFSISSVVSVVVTSMGSSPITEQILDKYNIFKKSQNKKIEKNDWDLIGFDETVMVEINQLKIIPCKIKHFNNKLLELDYIHMINNINNRDPNYLNMEGFFKNNYIQF